MSNRRTGAKGHTIKNHPGQSKCQYTQNLIGIPLFDQRKQCWHQRSTSEVDYNYRYGKVLL